MVESSMRTDPEAADARAPSEFNETAKEPSNNFTSRVEPATRERILNDRDNDPLLHPGYSSFPPMSDALGISRDEDKQPVKRSWRRKYRKMRAKFEDTITESNTLIKGEHKAMAIARRLQEQNDQLLDLLLDINESTRVPGFLRYDLRSPSPSESVVPSLEADTESDPIAIENTIREARAEMIAGKLSPEDFAQLETKLNNARSAINNPRTLSVLAAKTPHTTQAPEILPEGLLLSSDAPAYLDPLHEEEYLLAVDAAMADPTVYDSSARDGRPIPIPRHIIPSDKDLTIQNPDSVYNWLRKHQPQVFLQDKDPQHPENLSEKSGARPGNASGRGGKRPSVAPGGLKTEQDMLDDELGFVPESGTGSAKGRRGNKDDEPYRPKGGSSRPTKRKREDGESGGRGGRKKSRASGGAASVVAGS